MGAKVKSVKLNMIMNAILTMSNIVFPLITFPYVSRILLPAGMGKISFATSVVAYFSMFAQLGIPTYGIRTCAKIRDDKDKLSKTVQELLFINVAMVIVSYVAFTISILAVPRFYQEKELLIIMGITILLNAMGVEWLYKALEQYSYITIRSIIFKLVALAAMFILIQNPEDYLIYGGITIFAASASNVLNFINLRKYVSFKWCGNYNFRQHMKPMLMFFAVSVAATIYTNLDNVMLGFMKTDVEVGYYTAAVKVKTILVSLVTSASVVLLPRASHYVEKGETKEFYRILNKTMHFILLMAIPLAVYFSIYAEDSIILLSGKEFMGSIIPMQVIMPTLILVGMTNLIGIQMLVPLGREKQVFWSEIYGAIVNLILNSFLIPRLGATGAAIGTLVAEIIVLVVQIIYVRDKMGEILADIPRGKMVLANVLATVSSFWVAFMELGVFTTLLVSAVIFFGVYGVALLVCKEKLVMEILGGFKKNVI